MLLFVAATAKSTSSSEALRYGKYAVLIIVAGLLLWIGRQFLSGALNQLGAKSVDGAISRMSQAGHLRGGRLRKYRRAVQINFANHPLGFVGTGAIDIKSVYVPLRYDVNGHREDIYARIRKEERSVVTGPAGAGKSLLLKNSMLTWAAPATDGSGNNDNRRVPVLIELHRVTSSESDIPQLVMEELARNQVRRAKSFVEKKLREGHLRLLFDGLDEVGKERQEYVINMLRDFARSYPACQIVVTCRDAVYHGQLSPEFEHVVRIADLDDVSIRQLLGNWPGMDRVDVDSLTYTLRSNPPLMHLARSPLLLTMISYLYVNRFAKTGRTLPSSRVTFYEMAITHLLGRDRDLGRGLSLSTYDVGDKLSVLERIAVALQETARGINDRKEISHTQAIAVTRNVLPDINLDSANAKPLLEEIVDRSQLLIPLNRSRTEYAFRHLTLQEYLVARELADKPDLLMARYRSDPDSWREVVKLWCGGIRNSTSVVQDVMEFGTVQRQVLALECLAEAKLIDDEFATKVISRFVPLLGESGMEGTAVISAFGALAASEGPRGQGVLATLIGMATDPNNQDHSVRRSAFLALSESGRLEAAETLAPLAAVDEAARAALRAMGELAIPALGQRARADLQALDDLALIGTPAAAEALAGLLWLDEVVAVRAAWWLAELLLNPDVEEGLKHARIDIDAAAPRHDWIWNPFTNPGSQDGDMSAIIGRVGYLIESNPDISLPDLSTEIDARIAIPIVGLTIGNKILQNPKLIANIIREDPKLFHSVSHIPVVAPLPGSLMAEVERYFISRARRGDGPNDRDNQIYSIILSQLDIDKACRTLMDKMQWPVRARMLAAIFTPRMKKIQRRDWLEVGQHPHSATLFWSLFASACAIAFLGAAAFAGYWQIETIRGVSSLGPQWSSWLALTVIAASIITFLSTVVRAERKIYDNIALCSFIALIVLTLGDIVEAGFVLASWEGWIDVLLIILAVLCSLTGLGILASRRSLRFGNPLRHCLDAGGRSFSDRTSVIAK